MNYTPVSYGLVSHQPVNLCYVVPALVVQQVSSPVVPGGHDQCSFDSGNGSVSGFDHSSVNEQPILSWADEVEAEFNEKELKVSGAANSTAELNQPEPVGLTRFDVNLQAENFDLRDENDALRAENNKLKIELAALKEERLKNVSLDVEIVEDAKIKAILEAINVTERVMNRLPAKDPSILARVEALLRMKDELVFIGHFTKECKRLIGGYKNVDGHHDDTLMTYLQTADHNQFLSALFEMYYDNHSKAEVVSLLSYLHKFNFNVNLDKQAVIDVTRVKYNNNIDANDVSIKVDFDDLVSGSDYVYGTHGLEGFPLAMMHALSHVDSTINGKGLAKYHVGAACRMNECSIVEVFSNGVSKRYKPFKCWDSYVILPTLEGEVNGRVEAVLHHVGVTYITLVRCYDKLDRLRAQRLHHNDYLINGSISRRCQRWLISISLRLLTCSLLKMVYVYIQWVVVIIYLTGLTVVIIHIKEMENSNVHINNQAITLDSIVIMCLHQNTTAILRSSSAITISGTGVSNLINSVTLVKSKGQSGILIQLIVGGVTIRFCNWFKCILICTVAGTYSRSSPCMTY
ncbi:VP5 [Kadipiro virus]|uniref:VP5 n=1 Tax=Kadipiro virus TaxID=104580 RepID=Q9INI7_9REOV|nr:VP5 [Kadipiro virus]AAF78853.1 VP5 [Kadipiro virus]